MLVLLLLFCCCLLTTRLVMLSGDLTIYATFVAKSLSQFAEDVGVHNSGSCLRRFEFWLLLFALGIGTPSVVALER